MDKPQQDPDPRPLTFHVSVDPAERDLFAAHDETPGRTVELVVDLDVMEAARLILYKYRTRTGRRAGALILGWRTYLQLCYLWQKQRTMPGEPVFPPELAEFDGAPIVIDGEAADRIYAAPTVHDVSVVLP